MTRLAAGLSPFRLRFQRAMRSAHDTWQERTGTFLWVRDRSGRRGFGEISPLSGHSLETEYDSCRALELLMADQIPEFDTLESLEQWLDQQSLPASARSALEAAWLDLLAQHQAVPVHRLFPAPSQETIRLAAWIDPLDAFARDRLERWIADGLAAIKLKLDRPALSPAQRELLDQVRGRVSIRLDANESLDAAQLAQLIEQLRDQPIEFIEQPLPRGRLSELPTDLPVAIAVDEELATAHGIEAALNHSAVSVLVLKPQLLGGIIPSRRLAERARAAGKDVVVTHMLEAVVGHATACELALSLSPAPPACGLWPVPAEDCGISPDGAAQIHGTVLRRGGYVGLGAGPE